MTNVALCVFILEEQGLLKISSSKTKLSTCVQNIWYTDVVSYVGRAFGDPLIRMIMLTMPSTSFDISDMNQRPVKGRIIGSKIAKFFHTDQL